MKLREMLFVGGWSFEASSLPSLDDWIEERWAILGYRVVLGDDLRNPACED